METTPALPEKEVANHTSEKNPLVPYEPPLSLSPKPPQTPVVPESPTENADDPQAVSLC